MLTKSSALDPRAAAVKKAKLYHHEAVTLDWGGRKETKKLKQNMRGGGKCYEEKNKAE